MIRKLIILMAPLLVVGCTRPREAVDRAEGVHLTVRAIQDKEHLGHSTDAGESGGHPVWIDGCRGQIVGTDEALMLWWNGGEIQNYPFQFENGKTYKLTIKGEVGDGVMGFQGKSIHIGQILKVK